jgi:hypothetical protein
MVLLRLELAEKGCPCLRECHTAMRVLLFSSFGRAVTLE